MDLSALIFVALAAAWAIYLVPKALRAHEVDSVTRGVDKFSDHMRVLARREADATGSAEFVVGARSRTTTDASAAAQTLAGGVAAEHEAADDTSSPEAPESPEESAPLEAVAPGRRTQAARRAARRRRRVLGLLLLAVAVVVGLAAASVIAWAYVAIPGGLVVAWLLACRLSVRRERLRARGRIDAPAVVSAPASSVAGDEVTASELTVDEIVTGDIPVVPAVESEAAACGWDPVPMTLPTYVAKAPAGRTVRTIDIDSTGVWSSGRNEADSQLARDAETRDKFDAQDDVERRAAGS